jgi:hypothetical protein
MKITLKENYTNRVLTDISIERAVGLHLSRANGGQIEQLEQEVVMLSDIVARLIERLAKDEQDAVELIGLYGWDVKK